MSILRLTGVTREVGRFRDLDARSMRRSAPGRPDRLVGPNLGKTTLLRARWPVHELTAERLHRKPGLTSSESLAQEAHFDEAFMALLDTAPAAHSGFHAAAGRDGARRARGHRRVRRALAPIRFLLGIRSTNARAPSGLGFTRDAMVVSCRRRYREERHGSRHRRRDLLLLDEPTNHLDLDALSTARGAPPPAVRFASPPRPGLPRRHGRAGLGVAPPPKHGVPRRLTAPITGSASSATRAPSRTSTAQAQQSPRREADRALPESSQVQQATRHEARLEKLEAERRQGGRKLATYDRAARGRRAAAE